MTINVLKLIGKKNTTNTLPTEKKSVLGIKLPSSVLNKTNQTVKTSQTTEQKEIMPDTKKVFTLPEHLGGGQYLSGEPGELVKEERGYGTMQTKVGYERDHKIPVALGGTSDDHNMQYLENKRSFIEKILDKPAQLKNRQEGKVLVEWKAIDDYKSGKISLDEARVRVLNWNNQPESAYKFFAKSYLEAAKDTTTGFLKQMKESASMVARAVLPKSLERALNIPQAFSDKPFATLSKEVIKKEAEKARKEEQEYGFGMSKTEELLKGVSRGTKSFAGETTANLLNWYGENLEAGKIPTNPIVSRLLKTPFGQRAQQVTGELMINTGNKLRAYTQKAVSEGWEVEHPYLQDKTIFNDKRHAKLFSSIGQAVPSLGVAAGATAITGNPYVGASLLGLSQGADTYRNLREKGVSIEKANLYGVLDAVGSTLLEKMPLDDIMRGSIGMSMVKEGTQEAVQQAWSNAMNIWGGDDTRKYLEGVLESFIIGAASGGIVSAFVNGTNQVKLKALETKAKEAGMTDKDLDLIKEQVAGIVTENAKTIEPILQQQLSLPLDKTTSKETFSKIAEDTRKLQPQKQKEVALNILNKVTATVEETKKKKEEEKTIENEIINSIEKAKEGGKKLNEFLKENGSIFHSTTADNAKLIEEKGLDMTKAKREQGIFASPDKEMTKKYGDTTIEIKPVATVKELNITDKVYAEIFKKAKTMKEIVLEARKQGYDIITSDKKGETIILSPNKFKTIKQISNIWNKAQEKAKAIVEKEAEKIKEVISTEKKRKLGVQKPPKQKGNIRESQAFKRYKEELGIEFPDKAEYDIINLAEDRARAFEFMKDNREQAIRISKGLDLPPEGILQNHIDREILESELAKPKNEQDTKLVATVAKRQSLRLTRAGEEMVSQRGAYLNNNYQFFIHKILEQRVHQAFKIDYRKNKETKKAKFTSKISEQAKNIKDEINKKAAKIKSAEEIINSLIC